MRQCHRHGSLQATWAGVTGQTTPIHARSSSLWPEQGPTAPCNRHRASFIQRKEGGRKGRQQSEWRKSRESGGEAAPGLVLALAPLAVKADRKPAGSVDAAGALSAQGTASQAKIRDLEQAEGFDQTLTRREACAPEALAGARLLWTGTASRGRRKISKMKRTSSQWPLYGREIKAEGMGDGGQGAGASRDTWCGEQRLVIHGGGDA